MSPRHRTAVRQFYGLGISLLVAGHAAGALVIDSLPDGFDVEPTTLAVNFNEVEPLPGLLATRTEPWGARCDTPEVRHPHEVVPQQLQTPAAGVSLDSAISPECATGATDDLPPAAAKSNPLGTQMVALGDEALDAIRGGFDVPDTNLRFSFGIERAVFINGDLVSTTALNLRDLQSAVGAGKGPDALITGMPGAFVAIQNGAGNSVPTQLGANLNGTVIQNSLDNQRIHTVTTINAAVNSAQLLRAMSLQSAVQNGIVGSLRQ